MKKCQIKKKKITKVVKELKKKLLAYLVGIISYRGSPSW